MAGADRRPDPAPTAAARLEAVWQTGGPRQWLLRPLAGLHGALVGLRRTLYRAGVLRTGRLDVPVIVVGNRVTGVLPAPPATAPASSRAATAATSATPARCAPTAAPPRSATSRC